MKLLVAEDESVTRRILESGLARLGYEVVSASNGREALDHMLAPEGPSLGILDWNMPGLTGPEICGQLRARQGGNYTYLILLTSRAETMDIVAGLNAGADDFMSKPFHLEELKARVRAGERILSLEASLAKKISELESEKAHVKQLQGMLLICMHCHRVKTNPKAWQRIDHYIEAQTDTRISHGLCDGCLEKHYPED